MGGGKALGAEERRRQVLRVLLPSGGTCSPGPSWAMADLRETHKQTTSGGNGVEGKQNWVRCRLRRWHNIEG